MSDWIDVADVRDVALNTKERFRLNDDIAIIVTNLAGDFYAVEDICSHDGGILSDGWLENCELVCPRHGAHFCAKTGEALSAPAYESIKCYPLKVEHGKIKIKLT